jgi:hypothetical protein
MLLLGEHQVNGPATAPVCPRTPEVVEEGGSRATGLFEGVPEDGEVVVVERPGG